MIRLYVLILLFLFSCSPDYSEINFIETNFDNRTLKIIDIIGGSDEDIVNKVISTKDGGFMIIG